MSNVDFFDILSLQLTLTHGFTPTDQLVYLHGRKEALIEISLYLNFGSLCAMAV